ncbi:MAG TPA: Mur ligase family protein, partial [Candidatus Saccharimonadales bacterium]|nr:Mur ligase family protein [Candidatus Saccharimonadales bacterium]
MFTTLLIKIAKLISYTSKLFNLGNGSTWPGHLALAYNPHIIEKLLAHSKTEVILVVGTNGKTTTSMMLATILKHNGSRVIQNTSGANLLNGVASTLLLSTNTQGKLTADYAVFEVDENNLPLLLEHITPKAIIALNLFRDQLDRYGEVDSIAHKWNKAFQKLAATTTLVLNADDPLIAYLAKEVKAPVVYFGLDTTQNEQKTLEHAADSIYCPQCGSKLTYQKIFYSHLGKWECPHCGVKRPLPQLTTSFYPLSGTYNEYNTLGAVLTANIVGISESTTQEALRSVKPAFGRQEKISYKDKNVQIFLAKNPTSFNESLRTVSELKASTVLLILNDRIPDGRDVSWIWDIDIEKQVDEFDNIIVSGDRTYDLALRLHYTQEKGHVLPAKFTIEENLEKAIHTALELTPKNETLY